MRRALVAALLLAACSGTRAAPGTRDDAGGRPGATAADAIASVVPPLPRSDDGDAAMRTLDASIEAARGDDVALVPRLLERARIRGALEDYQEALAASARQVRAQPTSERAWLARIEALTAVHQLAAAQDAVLQLSRIVGPAIAASVVADHALAIDQARGTELAAVVPARAARAREAPNAQTLTLYAATLAEAGRFDEATALIPRAAAALRSNTPAYINWLLFQWGRIHELNGERAVARDFYREAHRRLPAHVETIEHLADTLAATGDRAAAEALATRAVAANPHPALRTLAYRLRAASDPAEAAHIAAAWERYVAALPEAFGDHAARALAVLGTDPERAFVLARTSFDARPTPRARELVLEIGLQVPGAQPRACSYVGPFATGGTRRQRFLAWRALSACGRTAEANELAARLGIAAP